MITYSRKMNNFNNLVDKIIFTRKVNKRIFFTIDRVPLAVSGLKKFAVLINKTRTALTEEKFGKRIKTQACKEKTFPDKRAIFFTSFYPLLFFV